MPGIDLLQGELIQNLRSSAKDTIFMLMKEIHIYVTRNIPIDFTNAAMVAIPKKYNSQTSEDIGR